VRRGGDEGGEKERGSSGSRNKTKEWGGSYLEQEKKRGVRSSGILRSKQKRKGTSGLITNRPKRGGAPRLGANLKKRDDRRRGGEDAKGETKLTVSGICRWGKRGEPETLRLSTQKEKNLGGGGPDEKKYC